MWKKSLISALPPALLGGFFTLYLYSQNIDLVPYSDFWVPLLISIAAGLALYGIFWLIFRSQEKASLISFIIVGALFSYGYSRYASIALLGIAAMAIVWLKFSQHTYRSLTMILTIIAAGLVVVPSANIVVGLGNQAVSSTSSPQVSQTAAKSPDIYYIIFDSYAGEKDISEIGFDNSNIYSFLKDQGFYIADQAYCNYPRTYLSLASSLNMGYLEKNNDVIGYTEACKLIEDNQVVNLLKNNGYRYYHIGSETFLPTASSHYADRNFEYLIGNPVYNEFSVALFGTTVLGKLVQDKWQPDLRLSEREAVLYQLDTLNKIAVDNAHDNQPTFTFCHILLPHHDERLFNADGTYPAGDQLARSIEEDYVNKISYLNTCIKTLASNLLSNKDDLPVIIFQGDEGISSTEFTKLTQGRFNQALQLPDNIVAQRAWILNAIYLPEGANDSLYSTLSPINTFRIIFNRYFGTNYDLLPDQFYFPRVYAGAGDGSPSSGFYDATALVKP